MAAIDNANVIECKNEVDPLWEEETKTFYENSEINIKREFDDKPIGYNDNEEGNLKETLDNINNIRIKKESVENINYIEISVEAVKNDNDSKTTEKADKLEEMVAIDNADVIECKNEVDPLWEEETNLTFYDNSEINIKSELDETPIDYNVNEEANLKETVVNVEIIRIKNDSFENFNNIEFPDENVKNDNYIETTEKTVKNFYNLPGDCVDELHSEIPEGSPHCERSALRFASQEALDDHKKWSAKHADESSVSKTSNYRFGPHYNITNHLPTEPEVEEISNVVDREQFYAELQKYYRGLHIENKKTEWTTEKIQNVIHLIEEYNVAKIQRKRPSDKQYYNAKKYDIVNVGNEKVLILKRKTQSDPTIRIIPSSDFYQIIHDAHIETGHGRRDKINYALKDKYAVPICAINIFLQMCKTCPSKKKITKHGIVVKPLISDDFNRRGQVDLVDFQSSPDKEYKWLLQYQDHLTKFCFLRPLKSKDAKEVAIELLKIFLEVGCPNILQSDNGREFTSAVLKEVASLWPTCKIINGRPKYPQSQGSIESSNQDVKNILRAWMVDHNSTNWSMGCYFAQFQINSSYHPTIARTPFKALFGDDPRLGLSSTHLSKNIISKLETEEDLEFFFHDINKSNDNSQNSETHTTDQQQKVSRDNVENITHQVVVSNKSNMTLNTHKYPVINEEVTILNSEINVPKTNEPENAPIPTVKSKITILDQVIISPPKKNIPAVGSEIPISKNNCDIVPSETIAIAEEPNILICYICDQETSGIIRCQNCNGMIHATCGVSNEEGCSLQMSCNLCAKENSISQERKESYQNLKRAAKKMTAVSSKKSKDIDIGTTVLKEVPKVDRGLLDSKNIVGKVIEKTNDLYRVGTHFGIISDSIPRNAVLSSPNAIISGDIPEITLPLRTIAAKCSSFGGQGQGMTQCNCKEYNRKQCVTNRCNCKKAKVLCNSRCHKSLTCHNK